jgi:hypothetical protein
MLRLLPRDDAIRLLLYRLREQTSVTAATVSPDADYDDIAELAKTMLTGDGKVGRPSSGAANRFVSVGSIARAPGLATERIGARGAGSDGPTPRSHSSRLRAMITEKGAAMPPATR